MILDRILAAKEIEVAARKSALPLRELEAQLADAPPALDFAAGLTRSASGIPAVIAEVKKASPSKGLIRRDFDPEAIARSYEAAGASAISVLTDEEFFQGSLDYLRRVKRTVSLPVLRKDFIIDEYQIYEARAAGADAILLIVAALERDRLLQLFRLAKALGLTCLVETHEEKEMRTALSTCPGLIGINNRNLHTFEVSLGTTYALLRSAKGMTTPGNGPAGAPQGGVSTFVSESGIFTRGDMIELGTIGVDAVLIGEALMREADIESKLRELIG